VHKGRRHSTGEFVAMKVLTLANRTIVNSSRSQRRRRRHITYAESSTWPQFHIQRSSN
jgi:hypothetical protein